MIKSVTLMLCLISIPVLPVRSQTIKPPNPPTPIQTPLPTTTPSLPPPVAAPVPPPPPPAATQTTIEKDDLNNPLEAPQSIDKILSTRMNADRWALMYAPLTCLDTSLTCVQTLQSEAVVNSPVIRELESKIGDINSKIAEAKTNNRKSINLAIFEPALQVFITQKTVIERGETRTLGFLDRVGQIFTNPGSIFNDLLSGAGIPILRGLVGGSPEQQSRSIAITDLAVKVAELERAKAEIAAKTRDRIQELVLNYDVAAREFQAEQSIVFSQQRTFKIYTVTYAAGDGDTNTYLNRKENLEKSKLQVFKAWAKLRAQISTIKNLVIPRE